MKLSSALTIASCLFTFVTSMPVIDKRQAIGNDSISTASNRPATDEEVENLKYYMTLAGNAYCSSVIPDGKWECGNCDRTANMIIVKLFTTPKWDTNAMVVRDDKTKRIISVFRGSVSTKNFQAVRIIMCFWKKNMNDNKQFIG